VKLADSTGSVDLGLWGEQAVEFTADAGSVVGAKGLKVSDWDQRSLSTGYSAKFTFSPDLPDAQRLLTWFRATGGSDAKAIGGAMAFTKGAGSLGRKYFSNIDTENLGRKPDGKADTADFRAVVTSVKMDPLWYESCGACKKKVQQIDGGSWKCEKCDKTLPDSTTRWMTSVQVSDNTETKWISFFDEVGKAFWGCDARELRDQAATDSTAIAAKVQVVLNQPFLFQLRLKEEQRPGSDDREVKLTCNKATPLTKSDLISENEALVLAIQAYHQ
jgi:replication factor A1